jgi:hypothetical protein
MKKIIIVFIMGIISISAYSQVDNRENPGNDIKVYYQENVNPFIIEQQDIYIAGLSDEDRETVLQLKDKMKKQKNGTRSYNDQPSNRGRNAGRGKGKNQPRFKNDNNDQSKVTAELQQITDNYPDLNKNYSRAVESKIMIWKNDLSEMHSDMNFKPHGGRGGDPGYEIFFNRISTPEGLLLWNDVPFNRNRKTARFDNQKVNVNNDLNDKIIEYAQAEVVPVIVSERINFDSYLSADEKKIISDARAKIEVRKTMFKTWYESEDFVPGQRAKDPNFDGMREDMRSSMQKVRGISLLHNDEMSKTLDNINSNDQKWDKDIENIALSFNDNPAEAIRFFHDNLNKEIMPVTFLLINTDKPDLFNNDKGMKVFIYPNPFSDKATIAIVGAKDKKVIIDLNNSKGKKIKEVFSGTVTDNRFEVSLLAEVVKNGAEMVTVTSGDIVIKRKISLSN